MPNSISRNGRFRPFGRRVSSSDNPVPETRTATAAPVEISRFTPVRSRLPMGVTVRPTLPALTEVRPAAEPTNFQDKLAFLKAASETSVEDAVKNLDGVKIGSHEVAALKTLKRDDLKKLYDISHIVASNSAGGVGSMEDLASWNINVGIYC